MATAAGKEREGRVAHEAGRPGGGQAHISLTPQGGRAWSGAQRCYAAKPRWVGPAMRAWAPAGAGDRYVESVTVNAFGTGAEDFLLFEGFLARE